MFFNQGDRIVEDFLRSLPAVLTSAGGLIAATLGSAAILYQKFNEGHKLREAAKRIIGWMQDKRPVDLHHPHKTLWEQLPWSYREDFDKLSGNKGVDHHRQEPTQIIPLETKEDS